MREIKAVEIDYLKDYGPDERSLNHFKSYYKELGINVHIVKHQMLTASQIENLGIPDANYLSGTDLGEIEEKYHDYTGYMIAGNSIAIYVFYANNIYCDRDEDNQYDPPEPYTDTNGDGTYTWDDGDGDDIFEWVDENNNGKYEPDIDTELDGDTSEPFVDTNWNTQYDGDELYNGVDGASGAAIAKGYVHDTAIKMINKARIELWRLTLERVTVEFVIDSDIILPRSEEEMVINAETYTLLHEVGHTIHIGDDKIKPHKKDKWLYEDLYQELIRVDKEYIDPIEVYTGSSKDPRTIPPKTVIFVVRVWIKIVEFDIFGEEIVIGVDILIFPYQVTTKVYTIMSGAIGTPLEIAAMLVLDPEYFKDDLGTLYLKDKESVEEYVCDP